MLLRAQAFQRVKYRSESLAEKGCSHLLVISSWWLHNNETKEKVIELIIFYFDNNSSDSCLPSIIPLIDELAKDSPPI